MLKILMLFCLFNGWEKSLDTGLNLTQNYYNSAWTGGDIGSITWTLFLNSDLKGPAGKNLILLNSLKLAFGQTYFQNSETEDWEVPQKSTDKIDDEITLTYSPGWIVSPYISNRFLSQFYDNSYPEIVRYIHPVDLTQTIGILKFLIKNERRNFDARVGFGAKEHIEKTIDTLMNKLSGTKTTVYGGIEFLSTGKFKMAKNLLYETKLRIFKAFLNSESENLKGTPYENYWKEPDIDFENTLSVSLSKYIQISIYAQIFYDKEQEKRAQIKENISLGIIWRMF